MSISKFDIIILRWFLEIHLYNHKLDNSKDIKKKACQ